MSVPRPVTQPPLNVKPKLNFSTHPSAKQLSSLELPPSQPLALSCQRNYGSESNLLDSLSSAADDTTVSGDGGSCLRTGMRSAGSVPDLLSPHPQYSEEPPPLPPERSVTSSMKSDAGGTQQSYYDSPGTGDSFYNTPPVKYPQQSDAMQFYNVPPISYPADRDNNVDGACYDVPPTDMTDKQSAKKGRKKQSKAEICEVTGGDVYNVPPVRYADDSVLSNSGKKSRKGYDAGITGSLDNHKSQTASTDQTYDVPPAEQWGGKVQSHKAALSASTTDETYDTLTRNEIKENKIRPQKVVDKQSIDFRPLTSVSDQTYDTPPTSESLIKTHPNKPIRGKPRSSLEPSETVRQSEQLSGQDTYDVPPTAQHPSSTVKPTVAVRSQQQSAMLTDAMYNVPPLKSATNRISQSGAADSTGLGQSYVAEEQTYNVPASYVPPVPAKRSPAPPPKPPRPTVPVSTHSVANTSVSSAQESVKATHDIFENEDTVAELPKGRIKGMLMYSVFIVIFYLSSVIF